MNLRPLLAPALPLLCAALLAATPPAFAQAVGRTAPSGAARATAQAGAMTPAQAQALLDDEGIAPVADNLAGAVMNARADVVEALLVLGVPPNAKAGSLPQTPLELAGVACAQWRAQDMPRLLAVFDTLLAHGANPNAPGMPELGAMLVAAQQCPGTVVERLAKAGGNLQARNPQGFTPLSMALLVGNADAAQALVRLGARLPAATGRKLQADLQDPAMKALARQATAGK